MKRFALIGMAVSLLVCLFGAISFFSTPKDFSSDIDSSSSYSSGILSIYDSGAASFGGDFYTYVNNNAAKAAEAVADAVDSVKTVTNNQRVLARQICAAGTIVARVVGALLVSLGLIAFCAFGMVYSKLKSEVAVTPAAEAQSHNPVVTEQTTAETV